jgi:hypothetical protein
MKRFLFILFVLPLATFAQRIEVNEVDKFTKERRVQTSYANLKIGMQAGLAASFRSVGSSYFMNIAGYGLGAGVIGSDEKAILLLDNEATVTVYSTGVQGYEVGQYQNRFDHQYRIAREDIQTLSQLNVKSIRRYTAKGYVDIDIPAKNQDEIKKMAAIFLRATGAAK